MRTVGFIYEVDVEPYGEWLPDYFFATREAAKEYLKGIGFTEFQDSYIHEYPVVDLEE